MTERKNSAEQVKKEFLTSGGARIGVEEWDEILKWVDDAYEEYKATHDDFNDYGYDFNTEVWNASIRKIAGMQDVGNGLKKCDYEATYVKPESNGQFVILIELGNIAHIVSAYPSDIIAYLALKTMQGEISVQEACMKLRRAGVR